MKVLYMPGFLSSFTVSTAYLHVGQKKLAVETGNEGIIKHSSMQCVKAWECESQMWFKCLLLLYS